MTTINLAKEAFNSKQTLVLTGISQKQLVYWDSEGVAKPSISPASGRGSRRLYSYMDLLALVTVKNLKGTGFSLQKIRKCVSYLRRRLPDISQPLSFCRLIACGETIYLAQDEKKYIDTLKRPGQTAVREIIDIAMFDRQLREGIVTLIAKRMEEVSVGDYCYQVEIEPDEQEGGYVGSVAGLPGCITDGQTLVQILDNAKDAIKCWLKARRDLQREGVRVPASKPRRRRRRTA